MGKAEPGSANQVPRWNTALLEAEFSHHGAARAQHAMHGRDHQPGRVSFQKEGARPALASCEYQKQICNLREPVPCLVSAKTISIPAYASLASVFPCAGSGFRCGEVKCGDCLSLPQLFQPLGFLRLRAAATSCQSGHAMLGQQTADG